MRTPTGRVLIVDDARINRLLLTTHVKEGGHHVECAADGREALEMLRLSSFDVVLLDLVMPKVSGYEVLAQIQEDPALRHIPVIVVSSVEDTQSVVRCIEMGAADYIFKPFNPVLIEARLNASLMRKRFHDAEEQHLAEIQAEQQRTAEVLYNILPRAIADRLKRGEREIVEYFPEATVLFADIVGFTKFSAEHTPVQVLQTLNTVFSAFDDLMEPHDAEKVKTIGDEYMAVCGIPVRHPSHAASATRLGQEMMRVLDSLSDELPGPITMRIGVHTGPVIAGVIGSRKFAFDLWGDTVNTAHRINGVASPGEIVVSGATHAALDGRFASTPRGSTPLRGRGALETFRID